LGENAQELLMASSNLVLWEMVERTDPQHVKKITGKSYAGNSPKPHYLVHKATEAFGPCGIGWGFTILSERIEEGSDGDKLHIARVKVWYEWGGKRGEVEHVGATPFSGKRASGKSFIDEDGPKKSVTDALVKALSMIGFAGDIFMGRYDDSKYVKELADEFDDEKRPTMTDLLTAAEAQLRAAAEKGMAELETVWNRLDPDLCQALAKMVNDTLVPLAKSKGTAPKRETRAQQRAKNANDVSYAQDAIDRDIAIAEFDAEHGSGD
jgi:hypothetical protein